MHTTPEHRSPNYSIGSPQKGTPEFFVDLSVRGIRARVFVAGVCRFGKKGCEVGVKAEGLQV